MKWIVPCNIKKYDIFGAFLNGDEIDWNMKNYKYAVGDVVYIYISSPHSKLMFKCIVTKVNIPSEKSIDDIRFWKDEISYEEDSLYTRFKMLNTFDDSRASIEALKHQGLHTAPNGPMTLKNYTKLTTYLAENESSFDDLNLKDYVELTWEEYSSLVWDILVGVAEQGKTIFYKDLTIQLNKHHRTARYMLDPIQRYCLQKNIPILTALVINKGDLKPGRGFMLNDYQSEMIKVWDFDWKKLENPFPKFTNNRSTIINRVEVNQKAVNRESLAKIRVGQGLFRDLLIQKNNDKCCMCNVTGKEMLIASHIKPWSECKQGEHLDPNNGLLLCPNHDKLFDKGLVSFDKEGKIIISQELDKNNIIFMNVNENMKIKINSKIETYMKFHRERLR